MGFGRHQINKKNFSLSVGRASYTFGDISGDSMAAFAFGDHKVALILSDGMGTGYDAAAKSGLVVKMIRLLLQEGVDVPLAIKVINRLLLSENQDEPFSTVDLAIIDRKNGSMELFKMGAAGSFVRRGGWVSLINGKGLPAGIIQGALPTYMDIKIRPGDMLVLVSDGVTDCCRQDTYGHWVKNFLTELKVNDAEKIAEQIAENAVNYYGRKVADDITVMVAIVGD